MPLKLFAIIAAICFQDVAPSKEQLVDNFFPRLSSSPDTGEIGRFSGTVSQVLDADNALVSYGDKTFWLKHSTKGMVDDEAYKFGLCRVTGTTQYQTVLGGSNTVYVVEPYTLPDAPIDKERYWVSADGVTILRAKFLKKERSKIHLQDRNEKVYKFSEASLCREDRKAIETALADLAKKQKQIPNRADVEKRLKELEADLQLKREELGKSLKDSENYKYRAAVVEFEKATKKKDKLAIMKADSAMKYEIQQEELKNDEITELKKKVSELKLLLQ
jgi:hypothetical protein